MSVLGRTAAAMESRRDSVVAPLPHRPLDPGTPAILHHCAAENGRNKYASRHGVWFKVAAPCNQSNYAAAGGSGRPQWALQPGCAPRRPRRGGALRWRARGGAGGSAGGYPAHVPTGRHRRCGSRLPARGHRSRHNVHTGSGELPDTAREAACQRSLYRAQSSAAQFSS